MKKNPSRFLKVIKRTAIVLAILAVAAFLILLYLSPGKTSPIVDTSGQTLPSSVAIIERPVIDGVEQSLIIRGEDTANPVLLFVHGGPGMPTFPFIKEQFKGMEKLFTICYWDQRGAGKSYSKTISPETMTLDQLTSDGLEVTRYLTKKFNKQKIYVLGHSWGTLLASFMIHERPELYHAYLGVGQLSNTYLSEQRSYQFVVEEAKKRNDQHALNGLKNLKIPAKDASGQEWYDYLWIERKLVFNYGGARYGVDRKISDLYKPMITCREYTLTEKMNYQTGLSFSMLHLWRYMLIKNPDTLLTEQKVPVYIFQGKHDHQTDFSLAKEYFVQLKAPEKKFYAFEHSAHSPHVEEYDAFEKIIRTDVIGRKE